MESLFSVLCPLDRVFVPGLGSVCCLSSEVPVVSPLDLMLVLIVHWVSEN